jgi:hypothetical protein
LISKKGQAKLALFWNKGNVTPLADGFCVGLHGLKPGFAWFQTQDNPAKNRVYFLTPPLRGPAIVVFATSAFMWKIQ